MDTVICIETVFQYFINKKAFHVCTTIQSELQMYSRKLLITCTERMELKVKVSAARLNTSNILIVPLLDGLRNENTDCSFYHVTEFL